MKEKQADIDFLTEAIQSPNIDQANTKKESKREVIKSKDKDIIKSKDKDIIKSKDRND